MSTGCHIKTLKVRALAVAIEASDHAEHQIIPDGGFRSGQP